MSAQPTTHVKEGTSSNKPICLPAGRYEFRDAGIYIGEWLDEKAVGLGLITKDKSQGEYTGLWHEGSEKSGVFLWPNAPGAMYEGEWSSNRRNGFGVFNREDWVIMGKFEDDFIVMGVKGKENTLARFEGRFKNGFPEFGVETYGDGGTYSGEYKNGIREGLGVRKSIPYGEVLDYYPEAKNASSSTTLEDLRKRGKLPSAANSLRRRPRCESDGSIDVPCESDVEDGDDVDLDRAAGDAEPYANRLKSTAVMAARERERVVRLLATRFKCGFVLTSRRSDLFIKRLIKLKHPRANPFGCGPPSSRKRTQSLSDLFSYPEETLQNLPTGCLKTMKENSTSFNSIARKSGKVTPAETDTLELDLVADDTIEIYSGEWLSDARHGFGVCERSDGVAYFGQWFKNQRHGLGHTRFPDGTFEQGRYLNGKLVFLALLAGNKPHLVLYNHKVIKQVQLIVERAMLAGEQANKKAIEAREQVSSCILDFVEKAKLSAASSREYSLEARELVREMYPEFEQPGIKYLEDIVRMMRVTRRGSPTFEAALQSAKDVIAGVLRGLTRTGEESSDDENQQPKEDLTLPPKFTSQLNEQLAANKKPISRAGSIRSQRRARIARMIRAQRGELTPEDIVEMGENPDAANGSKSTKMSEASKKSDTVDGQPIRREEAKSLTANGPSKLDGNKAKTLPSMSKRDQPGLINKTTANMLTKRNVGGGKKASKHQVYLSKDEEDADGTYVEIPNMTEISHHYEIPSLPLTKLLANPTLFSNHFDYYSKIEPPSSSKATAVITTPYLKTNQQQRAIFTAQKQILQHQGSRTEQQTSSPECFSIQVPQWKNTKAEAPQSSNDIEGTNVSSTSTFSLGSINALIPGHQAPSESQLLASKLLNPKSSGAPSSTNQQEGRHLNHHSDVFDWFRSNIFLITIIILNFCLLHVFFNQFGRGEEGE